MAGLTAWLKEKRSSRERPVTSIVVVAAGSAARMEGVDTAAGETWYSAGQAWAIQAGISDGTNMAGSITREQLAAMLYRYAQSKGLDVSAAAQLDAYADSASVSSWARSAMEWAVGAGLIQGSAGQLAPQGTAMRAETAVILARFAQLAQ